MGENVEMVVGRKDNDDKLLRRPRGHHHSNNMGERADSGMLDEEKG